MIMHQEVINYKKARSERKGEKDVAFLRRGFLQMPPHLPKFKSCLENEFIQLKSDSQIVLAEGYPCWGAAEQRWSNGDGEISPLLLLYTTPSCPGVGGLDANRVLVGLSPKLLTACLEKA